MKHLIRSIISGALVLLFVSAAYSAPATRVSDAIWANDKLYDTVATDTSFLLPPLHSTDVIYSFMMSGLTGQRSVSASAPGDRDFNGGRWSVKMTIFTDLGKTVHDPDNDGAVNFELTSEEDILEHLALGHLDIFDTSFYFECPLLPRKNHPGN